MGAGNVSGPSHSAGRCLDMFPSTEPGDRRGSPALPRRIAVCWLRRASHRQPKPGGASGLLGELGCSQAAGSHSGGSKDGTGDWFPSPSWLRADTITLRR